MNNITKIITKAQNALSLAEDYETLRDSTNAWLEIIKKEIAKTGAGKIIDTTKKLCLTQYVGKGEYKDKEFKLLVGAMNFAPVVSYKSKQFTLSWEDILNLAKESGLFDEDGEK